MTYLVFVLVLGNGSVLPNGILCLAHHWPYQATGVGGYIKDNEIQNQGITTLLMCGLEEDQQISR